MNDEIRFLKVRDSHGAVRLINIDFISNIEATELGCIFHMQNHDEIDVDISIEDVGMIVSNIEIDDVDG